MQNFYSGRFALPKTAKIRFMAFRTALAAFFLTCALPLLAADLTGKWQADVRSDVGSGTPVFVFKQEGEKLTGTYSGQLGDAKVTGTVKGSDVTFEFDGMVHVVYTGKLEEDGKKMSGSVDLGGQATGTFTAVKQ